MFLQQLIDEIMLGSTKLLVAFGYTLIFGVLNFLHFAHGAARETEVKAIK